MNCAQSAQQILNLGMYKTVSNYDMHALRATHFYQLYMDELRVKRATNFEARNVQLCEIMICTRSAGQNVQC